MSTKSKMLNLCRTPWWSSANFNPLIWIRWSLFNCRSSESCCVIWSNIMKFFFASCFDLCLKTLTFASVFLNLTMTGRIISCSPRDPMYFKNVGRVNDHSYCLFHDSACIIMEIFISSLFPS